MTHFVLTLLLFNFYWYWRIWMFCGHPTMHLFLLSAGLSIHYNHLLLLLRALLLEVLEAILAPGVKRSAHFWVWVWNMHQYTLTRMEAGTFIKLTVTQQCGTSWEHSGCELDTWPGFQMSACVYRPNHCNWRGNICIISYTVAMGVHELVTAETQGCWKLLIKFVLQAVSGKLRQKSPRTLTAHFKYDGKEA